MVTHTLNSCSAFIPSKVHTHISEHIHREHTPGAVGSHLCCCAWGAVGGSVSQGHLSRGIEGGESAGEPCSFSMSHLSNTPDLTHQLVSRGCKN